MWTWAVFSNAVCWGIFFPFLGLPHFFLVTKCETPRSSSEPPKLKESHPYLLLNNFSVWKLPYHQIKVLTQEYKVSSNEDCICLCLSNFDDFISLRSVRAGSVSALTLKSPPSPVILLEGLGLSKQSQMDKTCRWEDPSSLHS